MGSLRITTKCATVDDLVTTFSRYVDDESIFIPMKTPRAVAPRQAFQLRLTDGSVAMQGEAEIVESTLASESAGRAGIRVKLHQLDEASKAVHKRLLAARAEVEKVGVTARAETHSDYAQIEESGVRIPVEALKPEPVEMPAPPPTPAPPVLPKPPAPKLPPPGGRTVLGMAPPTPPAPPIPPPPSPGTLPAPTPLFGTGGTDGTPALMPLAEARKGLPDALPPPPAPPVLAGGAGAPLGRAGTSPAAAGAPRTGSTTGLETAWQNTPPALGDDEYAPEPDRRGKMIVGVSAGVGGVVLGLVLGFLVWGGKKPAPAVVASGESPAGAVAPGATAPPPAPGSDAAATAPAPPPAPAPPGAACVATIRSTPPGVDVLVDGQARGKTPLEALDVGCGEHAVALVHPRYDRIDRQIVVNAGTPAVVEEKLSRPMAVLELVSVPPGATFVVEGVGRSKAPGQLRTEAFMTRTVTASLPGYKPWKSKVYVKGKKVRVEARLEKAKRR
jgi:hypothetical protein